jgi:hypothetical protein
LAVELFQLSAKLLRGGFELGPGGVEFALDGRDFLAKLAELGRQRGRIR